MSAIKNIIFDLGGVLLNLDVNRTYQQLATLGGVTVEAMRQQAGSVAFFAEYEKGKISSADFRAELRRHLNTDVTDAKLDEAWNAMLLDFPAEKLMLLQSLGNTHRTFLLSNTNEIHLQSFTGTLRQMGVPQFDVFFERAYYSHLLGLRKPDHAIFEQVLKAERLLPGETLFIDDTHANVEAARELGIIAVHLGHPDQLFELFQ
ncbi:MAG: HAD family hydrolase [Flammeovirgaceae bacterium]